MRNWVLKSFVQGMISLFPGSQYLNRAFQHLVTKSLGLDQRLFELKVAECKKHLDNFFSLSPSPNNTSFSVLELGTGWHPIVPVGLYLCGAGTIWTIDRTSHLSIKRVQEALLFFNQYAETGELIKLLPKARQERIDKLQETLMGKFSATDEMLKQLNIHPLVCDARNTGLKESSIDLIESNTTLEYIPENILKGIFREFRRLASPTALMSHFISVGDHYADFDKSITPFNFRKYPSSLWRLFNNALHYQNRLLVSDYCKIHQDNGFRVLRTDNDNGLAEDLDKIRIAKEFRSYSREDLLVIRSWIASTSSNG